MEEWISVLKELPKRNETVYAKDGMGHAFKAIYFGRVIGWVNTETVSSALVTHWTSAV